MKLKALSAFCCLVCLLFLSGCDPKEMVEKKLPGPVKDLLSSSQKGQKAKIVDQAALASRLDIVSPLANSVYGVGEEVVFQAKVKELKVEDKDKPQIIWTLFGKETKGARIGGGGKVTKKLPAGRYKIQVALVAKDLKVEKSVSFRVAPKIYGTVTTYDGSPLSDVQIDLGDIGAQKARFSTRSGKEGQYSIEVPQEGFYELTSTKEGYSFFPVRRVVRFASPPVNQDFKAAQAQIKDISLTESPEAKENMESVCPLQGAYIRFSVLSPIKPESVDAQLVRVEQGSERVVQLQEISEPTGGERRTDAERTVMKVKVPAGMTVGPTHTSYRLRLTVHDAQKRAYSAEIPQVFDYDIQRCFRKTLADGVEDQRNGKLEQAITSYRMMATYQKRVDDPARFASFVRQSTFNRGLAYIGLAMEQPAESIDRLSLLTRAATDFQSVIDSNKNDLDAQLLLGWTFQLAGNPAKAEKFYDKILDVEPEFPAARELRARARIELVSGTLRRSKAKIEKLKPGSQNVMELSKRLLEQLKRLDASVEARLLGAIDDFTEALSTRPDDNSVRASRRQLLAAVHKLKDSEVNVADFSTNVRNLLAKKQHPDDLGHPLLAVDLSKVTMRDLDKVVDSKKRIRE